MLYNPWMENSSLFSRLAKDASDWRNDGYPCVRYPLIGEILAFQTSMQEGKPILKFLREPQFLALEVYWYVRLVLGTPHIIDLYKHYYQNSKREFFDALGVPISWDALELAEIDVVLQKIKKDEGLVKQWKIQPLHEAINLDYPSYILALAMGAGKTVLIGTIIATEFAMSLRYPKGNFMKNALVFAPGTTIIESLRELSDMPFDKIVPPGLSRDFLASLKIEFANRNKDIQTQKGSSYNLIVTNTEKISLRANRRRSNQSQQDFSRKEVEANRRLQTIASLPELGIFSDEAHHTYGNTLNQIKRVRETIDYIHTMRPVVAVINTTGTPYYKRQPLKEVIVWYGLGDGIRDNILKDLNKGIHQYSIGRQSEEEVFDDIIGEFFRTYAAVSLADGAKAKIAFYFKTQKHLEYSRLLIEKAMTGRGISVSQILVNTQQSSTTEVDEFKSLNNPANQKRVILLIGKGVEGWNCPSLFACALIKEQTKSNNYVLQAATRCLRQTPGNTHSAKVFIDIGNRRTLDKELRDNFGTDLDSLHWQTRNKETVTLEIVKTELPKLEITRTIKRAVRTEQAGGDITFHKPEPQEVPQTLRTILTPDFSGPGEILMPTGDIEELPFVSETTDCHTAAWKITSRYHLPALPVLNKLNSLYPEGEIPNSHLYGLFRQAETYQADYETVEEEATEVMALIRFRDENGREVFERDGDKYIHRLRLLRRTYNRMQAGGLLVSNADSDTDADVHNLSFHYTPYNFDSGPECSFFRQILSVLNTDPDDVEEFLFMGGLTDPGKTDFHFEYMGEDKRYHRYFPDFVIVKKTGEFCIVEVKSERDRGDRTVEAKRKAVERLQGLQPDRFRYHVIYSGADSVEAERIQPVLDWVVT